MNCDVWSLQFDNSVKMTHQSVKKEINTVHEIDSVRADDLKLLRGWRDLNSRYTFDASLVELEEW